MAASWRCGQHAGGLRADRLGTNEFRRPFGASELSDGTLASCAYWPPYAALGPQPCWPWTEARCQPASAAIRTVGPTWWPWPPGIRSSGSRPIRRRSRVLALKTATNLLRLEKNKPGKHDYDEPEPDDAMLSEGADAEGSWCGSCNGQAIHSFADFKGDDGGPPLLSSRNARQSNEAHSFSPCENCEICRKYGVTADGARRPWYPRGLRREGASLRRVFRSVVKAHLLSYNGSWRRQSGERSTCGEGRWSCAAKHQRGPPRQFARRASRQEGTLHPASQPSMSDLFHECGVAAIYHLPGARRAPCAPNRGPRKSRA